VYYLNNNFGTTLEVTYWSLASVQSVGHMAYSIVLQQKPSAKTAYSCANHFVYNYVPSCIEHNLINEYDRWVCFVQ
jgi:hypothetical protein